MDMLKGMTKKGQAEWYLIGLVIAVIVLVVVVWGFYSGWKFVPDTFSNFPKLDVAAQSCGFLAAPGSSSDYCSVYKPVEINGLKQYVTCTHLESYATFDKLPSTSCGDFALGQPKELKARAEFCDNQKLKPTDLINGESCTAAKARTIVPPKCADLGITDPTSVYSLESLVGSSCPVKNSKGGEIVASSDPLNFQQACCKYPKY